MSTIQQELVIKATADVGDAKQGLASLDQSVDGLASAQEGLKSASVGAAQGLAAEANAAASAASAVKGTAQASDQAATAAAKLEKESKGAGAGMVKAAGEGQKLTKQLKDVADGLDVSAGKMVNGLGGGGAIKALGGVGIAFGAVTAGAQAFMGSAESLFNSFGEEGQKVWGETTKSIDEIKGAFAEAVLGGGSVEEMGARLKGVFDGLKTATNFVLTPVKLLAQAFWGNSEASIEAAKGVREYNEAVVNSKKNQIELAENLKSMRLIYAELIGDTKTLTRYRYEDKIAALQAGVDEIKMAAEVQNAKIAANVAVAASGRIAESAHATTEMLVFRGFLQREKAAEHEKNLIEENTKILIEQTKARNLAMVGGRGAAIAEGEAMIAGARAEMGRVLTTGQMNGPFQEAGESAGRSFSTGISAGVSGSKEPEDAVLKVIQKLNAKAAAELAASGPARLAAREAEWTAEAEAAKAAAKKQNEQLDFLFSDEGLAQARAEDQAKNAAAKAAYNASPEGQAAAAAANSKAAADAQKAGQDQIQNIQETSGAVLDLAGAFAALGGVQDGVIDKMRQVVDVVIKIIQATEALRAVQAAQAAAKAAQDTAAAIAAGSTAVATAGVGAAATGAAASAGSAVVPILGAVAAVVGLMGSIFGGGSEAPRRDRGGSGKTIYTSAGEAQGAGGDFAYFEGGRQNVTIVTNDAASIRTMQGRLAFVGSRGGSGF
jgi:hypothetical protein